jgi:hypothetical protein
MQYVLRGTIAAATRVFGPAAPSPVPLEEIPEGELRQDDPEF